MSSETTEQALARIAAPFNNLRLTVDARLADRRHANALRRRGRELANSPATADDDRLLPFFNALSRHQSRLDVLNLALAKSQDIERAEIAELAPWIRPLVLLRGLCDRALIHSQMRRCRREMGICHEALGRAASGDALHQAPISHTQSGVDESTPEWTDALAREGRELGSAVLEQVRGKLVPRASALAGMAAGWWVASTYTDSHLKSIMNTVGIGKGGTRVVSGTMYKAMNFWLPILAAAVCAYLGDRLAREIRKRYESGDHS